MKVVVVGDMSYRGRYHLGDEAMSEVAVSELTSRGFSVTLVAGNPEVSTRMYGVPAVPRFGFVGIPQRADKIAHSDAILASVCGDAEPPAGTDVSIAALRAADALVIAGGGNLNTIGEHHLFERLTLMRIAKNLGIPLYVTSQTVGPHLLPPDQELVREIAEYARVFGVRESRTAELMRGLCGESATIVRTVDDAVLLDGSVVPIDPANPLPERYILGSFAADERTSGLDAEAYYRELAAILDQVVSVTDIDVLLVSHLGSLERDDRETRDFDDYAHERIRGYATSGRVRVLPMMSARELIALTEGASWTLSTRYHPLVFGAGVGIPAVGIVHSYYSAVRMRGALENSGMPDCAVPMEGWRPLLGEPLLRALVARRDEFAAHLRDVGGAQREYQTRWWDGIAADLRGTGTVVWDDYSYPQGPRWTDTETQLQLSHIRIATESVQLTRLQIQMTERDTDIRQRRKAVEQRGARDQSAALERELIALRGELTALRAELAEVLHRTRPPGAALRDRIRLALQRLRGQS